MEQLYRIGDVAKLFHLSVSSLRHYENTGLLQPEYVDPASGYRYYSARQFEVLNTIRYLRMLDMPLTEISDFLQNRDVDRIEEKLRRQKQEVAARQRELQRLERKIDNRLRQLQEARSAELDRPELVECPECRLVWMEDTLKIQGFLDMEAPIRRLEQAQTEAVVFLGKVGVGISAKNLLTGRFEQYDGAFLVLDAEDRFEGQTVTLPPEQAVRIRFRGSHPQAPAQYRALLRFAQNQGLQIHGFSREITMIDYGFTNDPAQFVTEITIPVERAET